MWPLLDRNRSSVKYCFGFNFHNSHTCISRWSSSTSDVSSAWLDSTSESSSATFDSADDSHVNAEIIFLWNCSKRSRASCKESWWAFELSTKKEIDNVIKKFFRNHTIWGIWKNNRRLAHCFNIYVETWKSYEKSLPFEIIFLIQTVVGQKLSGVLKTDYTKSTNLNFSHL